MMDTRELTKDIDEKSFFNDFEACKRKVIHHLDNEIDTLKSYVETTTDNTLEIIIKTLITIRDDIETKFDMSAGW